MPTSLMISKWFFFFYRWFVFHLVSSSVIWTQVIKMVQIKYTLALNYNQFCTLVVHVYTSMLNNSYCMSFGKYGHVKVEVDKEYIFSVAYLYKNFGPTKILKYEKVIPLLYHIVSINVFI